MFPLPAGQPNRPPVARPIYEADSTLPLTFLLLALFLLLPLCASAQMLFPELLPPDATMVLAAPNMDEAWQAFQSMPIEKAAAAFLQNTDPSGQSNPLTANSATLFNGALASAELAIAPARSIGGSPVYVWIARIRDLPRLRQVVQQFEEKAASQAVSPQNPVTRTTEGIGDSALKFLTDQRSTVGYFINGPHSLWAFANDPELLRETARKLAKQMPNPNSNSDDKSKPEKSAPEGAPFPLAAQAFAQLNAEDSKESFHLRFFALPSAEKENLSALAPKTGFSGFDPLLKALTPQGPTAGRVRFTPAAIRVESLSLYAPEDPSAALYKSASPLRKPITASFAVSDAMIEGGNCLLDVKLMKRYMLSAMKSTPAGPGLNESQRRAQERLTPLQQWAQDPNHLSELGPTWFFALNNLQFLEAGQFPQVDLLLGFETRNPDATRKAMLQLEDAMLKAGSSYIRDIMRNEEERAKREQGTGNREQAGTEKNAEKALTTATLVVNEALEKLPNGEATIRYFQSSKLPAHLRPAWTIHENRLFIGMSPEMLSQALHRSAKGDAKDSGIEAIQREMGVESFHAFQVVRFQRASKILIALLTPITRKINPDAVPMVSQLSPMLESIDAMAFFRRGTNAGVRTVGEIRMKKMTE